MNETEFHKAADATFLRLQDALEPHYEHGALELEFNHGVLTIETKGKRTFIVSKHAPSKQLWLSSPVSGGLHFSYDSQQRWSLADGRMLLTVLEAELSDAIAQKVTL